VNLQEAFAELRRQESTGAPRFEQLWRPRSPRRRAPIASLAFATLILIVAVFLTLRPHPQRPSITAWRPPTDFLLNTPGRELIHNLPDLKGTVR
jgi:hypothetical protein